MVLRKRNGVRMVRIRVIFIAVCIVLIAAALGAVLYLRLGFSVTDAVLVALCLPAAAAVYSAVAADKRERAVVNQQVSELVRGSSDLARQLADFDRRLGAAEGKVETVLDKALAATAPLAGEVEELSRLVKQLADLVAAHDVVLARPRGDDRGAPYAAAEAAPAAAIASAKPADPAAAPAVREVAAFSGLDKDAIIAAVRAAIEGGKIDLLPAAHRHFAAAQGALLRGDVPAQCGERRGRGGGRFPALCRGRFAAAEARRPCRVAMRAGGAAAVAQERRHRLVLQSFLSDA